MSLNDSQIEEYFAQGFLLLPALISAKELAQLDQRFLQLVESKDPLPTAMKIMQDVMVVKGAVEPATPVHGVNKMLCLENDADLFAYASNSNLVSAVQSLLGQDIYSLSSNIFNKPPAVDGRHPMHQDLRYFRLGPADKIVGVWTAMLPALRETGCLAVIPGSHKVGLLEHANPEWEFVNYGFLGVNEIDFEQRLHIEMQPGDTLLFHPLLVHGSGRNRSDQFRRAISVHYAAGDCESPGAAPSANWRHNPQTRRIG